MKSDICMLGIVSKVRSQFHLSLLALAEFLKGEEMEVLKQKNDSLSCVISSTCKCYDNYV